MKGLREKIARIIDPEAWTIFDAKNDYLGRRSTAASLAKADAILALAPSLSSQDRQCP